MAVLQCLSTKKWLFYAVSVHQEMAPFIRSNEVVEAHHQAPPLLRPYYGVARWNAKRAAIGLGPQVAGYSYGSGPGGWSLETNDWEDINLVIAKRSSERTRSVTGSESVDINTNTTDSTFWSPRAELSSYGEMPLLSSGGEGLESPEKVMDKVREELGVEDEEMMEQGEVERKRKRGSSSGDSSFIFSPILVKMGGEVVTVSTSNSERNSSRIENMSSPVFTFDINRELRRFGSERGGYMGQGSMVPPRSLAMTSVEVLFGEPKVNMYVDDLNKDGGEEENEEEMCVEDNDEVFHLSHIE